MFIATVRIFTSAQIDPSYLPGGTIQHMVSWAFASLLPDGSLIGSAILQGAHMMLCPSKYSKIA